MNRLIICTILLAIGNTAMAEQLYRWIESDGSITFSPTPPPAGVDYTAVKGTQSGTADVNRPAAANTQPSILATSEHEPGLPKARAIEPEVIVRQVPVQPKQGLSYAPSVGAMQPNTITTASNQSEPVQPPTSRGQTVASSNKARQCQDLSKRVLSLERRLRSPLAAEDMDNTVVAMARYQRSFDQHCVN